MKALTQLAVKSPVIDENSSFFFTFHKCASVLFSHYVLRQARGFKHIDLSGRKLVGADALHEEFSLRGHLYGPLRLSASGEVLERLIKPALDTVIHNHLPACLMIRDPRDMLVSQFFHNRDGTPVKPQLDAIEFGIDDYVIKNTGRFLAGFNRAVQLLADHPATQVLRYEDMVDDWNIFKDGLSKVFDLCPDSIRYIEKKSRPNPVERPGEHKRSGATGSYRSKLSPETTAILTEQFYPFLKKFGYLSGYGSNVESCTITKDIGCFRQRARE